MEGLDMGYMLAAFLIGAFSGMSFMYFAIKDDVLKGRVTFGQKLFKCEEIGKDS